MMATSRFPPGGVKATSSPRPKGRENNKDTLCRNVLIYGHCRYEDQGCSFNHEPNKLHGGPADLAQKKSLNVDSPAFTPAGLVANPSSTISSRSATATPFTPRGIASGTATPNVQMEESNPFNPAQIREFTPQAFDLSSSTLNGGSIEPQMAYDPFTMTQNNTQQAASAQYNPYLEDTNSMGQTNQQYYPAQSNYPSAQPVQYHLYAPIGPHREDLLAYQRNAHDFFMPEKLREEMQKKSEASLQVMPNSQLPTLENYHSLVALDTTHHKNATVFGYPSWVYKATSSKNGNLYCLRRLEGFRFTNEKSIRPVKDWKRLDNGGIVSVIDAFTTRAFGDASLIFVTDYHPLSRTLAENHFVHSGRFGNRASATISESMIWSYIVQLASAIKSVHTASLAVRCFEPSKIIVTSKSRIRFSACAILDVVQYDSPRQLSELQQEDLFSLGKLILSLATINPSLHLNLNNAIDQIGRTYSPNLTQTVRWLVQPGQKTLDDLLVAIAPHIVTSFDQSLHANDTLTSQLSRELENGRLVRLMAKLNVINDRPEYAESGMYAENEKQYILKLFRDYVWHQVDANGDPVVDLGHIISCLNKLDAGSEEKIMLASRDEQSVFVTTYQELKGAVATAFGELMNSKQGMKGARGY